MESDRIVSRVFSRLGMDFASRSDCSSLVHVRAILVRGRQWFLGDRLHFRVFGDAATELLAQRSDLARRKIRGHVVHSRVLHRTAVLVRSLRAEISDSDFCRTGSSDACDDVGFSRNFSNCRNKASVQISPWNTQGSRNQFLCILRASWTKSL